jgi:hypothetical protein
MIDLEFDMRQRGLAGSIYELQRHLETSAFVSQPGAEAEQGAIR